MEILDQINELSPGSGYRWQIFHIWPELINYDNTIHVIYAGTQPGIAFYHRGISDIIKEINIALSAGKTKFIFTNIAEGIMINYLEKIHKILKLVNIPYGNTFYATSSINGQEIYNKLAKEYNWSIPIIIMSCNLFQGMTQWKNIKREYTIRLKDKKFVCLNKVPRKHRLKLLDKMLSTGLINDAYYSFEGSTDLKDTIDFIGEFSYVKENLNLIPLRLNITEHRSNPVDIIEEDYVYHDNSYFSVVTETLFYKDFAEGMFISEKTYRPMAMQHPFIVLGPAGLLTTLKKYGYKTFSPFINESYDSILDNDQRFNVAVSEIERLSAFTDKQWLEWQSYIKDIVEYNKQHFFSVTDHRISTDIEQYFK